MKIEDAAIVPYKGTFLIVGGWRVAGGVYLDTVLRYNENGEWETLPIRLADARRLHVVIPKPAC